MSNDPRNDTPFISLPDRYWQHEETGRTVTMPESPGPRWQEMPSTPPIDWQERALTAEKKVAELRKELNDAGQVLAAITRETRRSLKVGTPSRWAEFLAGASEVLKWALILLCAQALLRALGW